MFLSDRNYYGIKLKNDFCYFFLYTKSLYYFQIQTWESVWHMSCNNNFEIEMTTRRSGEVLLKHKWEAWRANT